MKKRTRIIIIIVIIVAAAGGWYFLRIRNQQQSETTSQLPNISMKYTVTRTDIGDSLEVTGSVTASERKVYGRVSGEIKQLFVEENQSITKGATIAIIDSKQYELNYLQAQSAYDNSLGEAPKTVEEKKLSLDLAREDLEHTVITSPVSGFIGSVSYMENDVISSNSVVCTVVEDNEMYVEASVDEVDLTKIKVGQKVQFLFEPLDNLILHGEISEISPIANSSGGIVVIPIEFKFDESPKGTGVIPGLTCTVDIYLMENTDIIAVPILAVQEDEKGSYVMVDNQSNTRGGTDGSAASTQGEKRYVTVGQSTEQYVEIVEGLDEGEIIIIQPDVTRAVTVMQELDPNFNGGSMMMLTGGGGGPQGGGGMPPSGRP
ncbi:MAG TPA: efflux RND transporter periplasmic adaptor subunit [Thermotogota bacterium]|nr:efflux RND transporter periplasmic adaptor subunit [Thermotogota bacterium]HPJ89476.1 efflux RND transporter periplasmic adaptor subunit [Thermotogota bacterium]HPR96336.1 efflux RND transporter periplasmic adaptor subunit [Thermotogota bacterium]